MSALYEYLNDEKYEPELYDSDGWKLLDRARAELAQLRADLQAAQERIADLTEHDARTLERCDVCGCALMSDVLEGDDEYSDPYCPACLCEELSIMLAEQARQLEAARVLIGTINQRVYLKRDIQIEVNHWLAANPAPSSEPPRCTCGMGSATMTELHAKDCTLYRMAAAESQP